MSSFLLRKRGEQFRDNADNVLAGGKLWYFEAGTSNEQATYSDATGLAANTNPVELNGYGRLEEAVYLTDGPDYKELLTDANDVVIAPWPMDDIPAPAAEAVEATFAAPLLTWVQKTSAQSPVALVAADLGDAFEADTNLGNIEFDLPAASLCTNKGFWFKKTAAANSLVLDPNGSQTIDDVSASLTITAKDTLIGIFSNGAEWYTVTGYGLFRILNNLAEDTAPDSEADFLVSYDASAGIEKKVKFKNVPGRAVQRAYASSSTFTTTTVMPADATTPQVTEGGSVMSVTITPKSATNIIRFRAYGVFETNINATAFVGMALFKSTAAGALAVSSGSQADNGVQMPISLLYEEVSGGVAEITYSIRAGAGAAGTCSLGSTHGGGIRAGLIVEEIVP